MLEGNLKLSILRFVQSTAYNQGSSLGELIPILSSSIINDAEPLIDKLVLTCKSYKKNHLIIFSNGCFNLQLSSLQKDNHRLRSDLEREIATRQTLELQIESKEQTINSLKTQLETKKHLLIEHSSPLKDPERAVSYL